MSSTPKKFGSTLNIWRDSKNRSTCEKIIRSISKIVESTLKTVVSTSKICENTSKVFGSTLKYSEVLKNFWKYLKIFGSTLKIVESTFIHMNSHKKARNTSAQFLEVSEEHLKVLRILKEFNTKEVPAHK